MQSAFDVLQCGHVLEALSHRCKSGQGKAKMLSLRPLDPQSRDLELRFLAYATELIDQGGPLPLNDSSDLSARVDLARKGGTLQEEDFSRVLSDLNTLRDLKKHLTRLGVDNSLTVRVLALADLEPLRQAILRVLAPDLSIKDNASVELKRIRSTLHRKRSEITSRLGAILEAHKPYMSGNSWTMRNGHYVLPIANSFKHQVKGLVQDVSASGGTTFIEPEFLVKLHNDIALLEADEREEVRRILAALSRQLGSSCKDFLLINETIGYLDFLSAKASYAAEEDAHIASLSEDGSLFIPQGRHPLIDAKKVVPNDFRLSASRRILVLSGPNAGGKTVALKTLGILSMMFSMALPLPCGVGAEMPSFGQVYVDIGDSQSIFDNLSTFSGHVTNIKDILALAGKGDLVLLDEVGTGTSPKEGEALALAILDELAKKGCYALISSHFEGLKARALASTEVENASLLFDEETLSPTYMLRIGMPGESYGLEVARRLGLSEDVLKKAEGYLRQEGDRSIADSLRHLSELTAQAEQREASAKETQLSLQSKEKEIAALKKELQRKQERFDEEMKAERRRYLEQAKQEVEQAIKALSSPEVKLHQAIAAKKKLDDIECSEDQERFDEEIRVGDYVEIPAFGIEGRVMKLRGEKAEVVGREGVSFQTEVNSLHRIPAPEKEKKVAVTNVDALPTKGLPLEVHLIGLRVEEAMAELDRYLDRCRLKGYKRVRVIHGLGSGALRRATHEYLKAHGSFVERYELGGEYEGGGGATVVYLK